MLNDEEDQIQPWVAPFVHMRGEQAPGAVRILPLFLFALSLGRADMTNCFRHLL